MRAAAAGQHLIFSERNDLSLLVTGVETLPLGHPPDRLSMNASITYWRKL
jgi:hypothetical protein